MARTSSKATPKPADSRNMRLVVRAELRDSRPPIWRRLEIAPELRLHQVHQVLQAAFQWEDSHLHAFELSANKRKGVERRRFTLEMEQDWGMDNTSESETGVSVGELLVKKGDTLNYLYDFGDSWEVVLKLEKAVDAPLARCVDGSRACPPDDSGGIWRYEWTIATSQKPSSPDYEDAMEMMDWLAEMSGQEEWDPDAFDLEATDKDVRNSV